LLLTCLPAGLLLRFFTLEDLADVAAHDRPAVLRAIRAAGSGLVAGIIRRHRISIGSTWRKLKPGQQALVVLAYLRKGETFAALAAGFGVGTATAWRYVNETVALLAARAPRLRKAARDAKKAGHAYVVIDGTLIPIDRVAADRPFYSGKHKKHGMNLQVIASPAGGILWVSGALPGSVHDKKSRMDLGRAGRTGGRGPGYAGRQGLPGQRLREDPVQGEEQARITETGE
jgi:Helix-turn-helix of DDE superfamily endonuclease/DDE superfamily endonuclease